MAGEGKKEEVKIDLKENDKGEKLAIIGIEVNVTELAKEVYQNLPEYASVVCIVCHEWNYKDMIYKMYDEQEKVEYILNLDQIERGMGIFFNLCATGKLRFSVIDLLDPGNWDAEILDCAIQCSIFKEVIYG